MGKKLGHNPFQEWCRDNDITLVSIQRKYPTFALALGKIFNNIKMPTLIEAAMLELATEGAVRLEDWIFHPILQIGLIDTLERRLESTKEEVIRQFSTRQDPAMWRMSARLQRLRTRYGRYVVPHAIVHSNLTDKIVAAKRKQPKLPPLPTCVDDRTPYEWEPKVKQSAS